MSRRPRRNHSAAFKAKVKAYETVSAAREGLQAYLAFYNERRPHQAHAGRTPDMVYYAALAPIQAAA